MAMSKNGWSVEVVRGREPGRVFALAKGANVLGNALNGATGLDLSGQEGSSPRRMAPRQAELELSTQGLALRDLESPGGTFVNRQRILPGQTLALQEGDLIQLGGVQLKVVRQEAPASAMLKPTTPPVAAPVPTPAASVAGPLPSAFTLASGARCRSWDDFLTVAAQRWDALRDELVSGRLASFLTSVGRGSLAPSPTAPGTPDDRLDTWLGTLPTTKPSRPELDVHPGALVVKAAQAGGVTRVALRINNTGYRLLRTRVRVEPTSCDWIKLAGGTAPFVTVDETELFLEVQVPDNRDALPTATLVLDSNGGTRRVEIKLERPSAPEPIPTDDQPASTGGSTLGAALIASQPMAVRLVAWSLVGALLRLLVLASNGLVTVSSQEPKPSLRSVLIVLGLIGLIAGGALGLIRGGPRDLLPSSFAGGYAGILAAAVLVAICRTVEPAFLGNGVGAGLLACLLWGLLGVGLAMLSGVVLPEPPRQEESR